MADKPPGVSSGLVCGVLPLYLIDISVEGFRGNSEYMHTSLWYLGVSLIYTTAPFISFLPLTITLLTLTVVWAIGMCWVPESPWYYFDRGREAKALESLSWLRGSQDIARREYDSTVSSRIQSCWRELLSKQVVVLSVLGILHWAFVPARLVYSYRNFLSITNSEDASIGIQLGQAFLCFVASSLSTFLLASSMRRTLIIRSLILALLSSIPTSVYLYNMNNRDSTTQIYVDSVAIGLIVVYPVLSSATFHSTTYVLSQEILYKDKHRKVAIYLAHLAAFLSAVSCIIVPILQRMDYDYINFSILSGIAFISLVFIFSCLPETKNKHIFEINRLFKS